MAVKRSLYEVDLPATWVREGTGQDDLDEWLEIGPRDVLHARGWHVTDLVGELSESGDPCGEYGCEVCEVGCAKGTFVLHTQVYAVNQESAVRLARMLAQGWFDQAEYDPDNAGIDWCQGPSVTFA